MNIINRLIANFTLGGKMSEAGADQAGKNISEGFGFFMKALGIGGGLALLFWQLPALAEFILTLKGVK